jgi:hypothetical protein
MYIRVYYQSTTQTLSITVDQSNSTGPVTKYQDNTSMIALIVRGKTGAERRKHNNNRHFWLHDKVKAKEGTIVHLETKEMYANKLTKPTQESQPMYGRDFLSGWRDSKNGW